MKSELIESTKVPRRINYPILMRWCSPLKEDKTEIIVLFSDVCSGTLIHQTVHGTDVTRGTVNRTVGYVSIAWEPATSPNWERFNGTIGLSND